MFFSTTIQTDSRYYQRYLIGRSLPSKSPPSYGHICKRINKIKVDIKGEVQGETKMAIDDDYIMITIDSSGAKITNRGQWMDKN
ncbi:hypothetical protein BH23THE1_BH23THE1_22060 [soil metagenome]